MTLTLIKILITKDKYIFCHLTLYSATVRMKIKIKKNIRKNKKNISRKEL